MQAASRRIIAYLRRSGFLEGFAGSTLSRLAEATARSPSGKLLLASRSSMLRLPQSLKRASISSDLGA
jgi:hypothetical protein